MLASFTDYLRATLGTLRHDDSTLADELELARSYLQLLQVRMDDRLRFRIEADEAARSQPLPPLLLQPLVENAIQHGLEPSIEGGTRARARPGAGRKLVLEVQDDGLGPTAAGAPQRRPPAQRRPGAGQHPRAPAHALRRRSPLSIEAAARHARRASNCRRSRTNR
jgi:sensor histidine kinase YesM